MKKSIALVLFGLSLLLSSCGGNNNNCPSGFVNTSNPNCPNYNPNYYYQNQNPGYQYPDYVNPNNFNGYPNNFGYPNNYGYPYNYNGYPNYYSH